MADVIQLAEVRARRALVSPEPARIDDPKTLADRFHFWTGASGRRYVHTVYSLIECPALPAGNYVLVRREADGQRSALAIGSVANTAASLNLAEIRRRGAELGANEVHIHLLAGTAKLSKLIEFDLRASQGVECPAQACH